VAGLIVPGSLEPGVWLLVAGVSLDLLLGDPVYAWHPVRLIGRLLTETENRLRATGFDGYGGGILLFLVLAAASLAAVLAVTLAAADVAPLLAWIVHLLVLYTLLALGDLVRHVWRIETSARSGDLVQARRAVSALVGRDTEYMDAAACRRAAVESLSENLTDGFVSPVFWYAVAGLPGVALFKVVSTMDSMVGYRTPRYLKFGWCGARLDDVMNYLPARLTWLIVSAVAAVLPSYSGSKAWRVGSEQHGLLVGPNSGWSEAGTAGAIQRRIVGPIWLNGVQVTDRWIGDPSDPPLESGTDVTRAVVLAVASGLVAAVVAALTIAVR
jgi:adenosylcobinamide-phosphate synthase